MKCLIVRFSSIGDIVLTTPVIRSIKTHDPSGTIHYLTKQKFAYLLEANPYLDKVYGIQNHITEHLSKLKVHDYDFVFDLHHNLRSFSLKLKLKKPSYSFHKLNLKKWILVRFKKDLLPQTHIVDRYLAVIKKAGIPSDGKGLDYFVPTDQGLDFSLLPKEFRGNYTVLAIGGTYATKRLPSHKLVELCRQIEGPIFIIGGPDDKEPANVIKQNLGERAYNGCGLFTVHESASIIEKGRMVVTHDTGAMHIAAAFNKPIASVWGNTVPAFGMYPYQAHKDSKIFEVKDLSCRPCSKLGYDSCPKKHFDCMEKQDVKSMAMYVNSK